MRTLYRRKTFWRVFFGDTPTFSGTGRAEDVVPPRHLHHPDPPHHTTNTFITPPPSLPSSTAAGSLSTPPRPSHYLQQPQHPSPYHHRSTIATIMPPFSSRRRRCGGLGCPPPNHHRGGGRTTVQPPQPHLVVSGCDGATPWDVLSGQPPKTTTVVAAEPTVTTTAAPKWASDANIIMEDVCNISVWVKFHDIPITVFMEAGLSAVTKLGKPLMLNSYTAAMCTYSWGRASYARAMVELRADVELKDTIVVVPKFVGEGYSMRTIHVEYKWTPPR
ncbi:hypothetical protein Tco_1025501 [Tanacetum coccineum]